MISARFQKLRLQAREAVPAGLYFMYRQEGEESLIPDFLVQFSKKSKKGPWGYYYVFEGQPYFLWYQTYFEIIVLQEGRKLFYIFVPLTQLKKNTCNLST